VPVFKENLALVPVLTCAKEKTSIDLRLELRRYCIIPFNQPSKQSHIFQILLSIIMASAESTPGKLVPRVIFPLFIVLAVSAVTYFGLRQCDCDDQQHASASTEVSAPHK